MSLFFSPRTVSGLQGLSKWGLFLSCDGYDDLRSFKTAGLRYIRIRDLISSRFHNKSCGTCDISGYHTYT